MANPSTQRTLSWSLLPRQVVAPLVFLVSALAIWEILLRYIPMSRGVVVPPSAIYRTLVSAFPILATHMVSTLKEIILGFCLASIVGISIGAVISMSKRIRQASYPNIVLFQLIPKAALAPLFVIWIGAGSPARLTFAVFMAFFPIAIAATTGLENTKAEAIKLCRSLTASDWQTFTRVRVPFAAPYIFAGLKVGMTMTMIGVIVGEFITGQEGLGYVIMFASSTGESSPLYAALFMLATLGLVLYSCVLLLEMAVQHWYGAPFVSEGFS